MPDILIRNVDEETAMALKKRAKKNGRSLQAELKLMLAESIDHDERRGEFERVQKRLLRSTATRPQADSTQLIREDRDSR